VRARVYIRARKKVALLTHNGKDWSRLNQTEWAEALDKLRDEGYRRIAKVYFSQDIQPCSCFQCKMHREYMRIDGYREIVRVPKPKRIPR